MFVLIALRRNNMEQECCKECKCEDAYNCCENSHCPCHLPSKVEEEKCPHCGKMKKLEDYEDMASEKYHICQDCIYKLEFEQ